LVLSYRWANKPSVEPLLEALRARSVRVWQDAREVGWPRQHPALRRHRPVGRARSSRGTPLDTTTRAPA